MQSNCDFGRRLATVLNERDMPQSDLAALSGVDSPAISRYISGAYKPRVDALVKIARALGVSTDYLCGLVPAPHTPQRDDLNFSLILCCAVRYALGRRTYIVGVVVDYVLAHLELLDSKTLSVMIRDIKECKNYGQDIDANDWMRLLAALEEVYDGKK